MKIKSILIILITFLSVFIISETFGTWYINANKNENMNEVENGISNDYHNIYIQYVTTKMGEAVKSGDPVLVASYTTVAGGTNTITDSVSGSSVGTSSAQSLYNQIYTAFNHTIGSASSGLRNPSFTAAGTAQTAKKEHSRTVNSDGTITIIEYTYSFTLLNTTTSGLLTKTTHYGVTGTITSQTYIQSIERKVETNSDGTILVQKTYKVKDGTVFNRPTITRTNDGEYGFTLNGFLIANSSDISTPSNTPYNFQSTVTKDLWLFAEWNQYTIGGSGADSQSYLTEYVTTLNGTGNIYDGGLDLNLSDDKGYNSYTKTVNLGYGSGTTTIPSSANVLFCMNSGDTDYVAQEGEKVTDSTDHKLADSYVSVDYTNTTNKANTCDYTIVLQNDLVINGNVTIGGYTGSSTEKNCFVNGHIIQNYVKLDLNGYNLTINDGGSLHSFGLITDSVGTSTITVNPGGVIKTQFVIYDVHGGNNTLWGYSKGIAPFYTYSLPYLECKTILKSNGSKSGGLVGFNKLNMGNLGITNLYIPLIGGSDYYMTYSGTDGYVEIDYNEIKTITNSENNDIELKNKFNYKNYIKFKNVQGGFNPDFKVSTGIYIDSIITIERDFDLAFGRITFPISTLFDIEIINSTFNIKQALMMMPGSSFVADGNSTINIGYAGTKTFDKVSAVLYTLPGETKEVLGSISAINEQWVNTGGFQFGMPDGLKGYSVYWSFFKEAQVNIYGTLSFDSASNTLPYTLSGNININNITYDNQVLSNNKVSASTIDTICANGVNLRTYNLDFLSSNNYWFSSDNSISERTVQHKYYTRPLICNDVAYVKDSSITNTYVGTHDYSTALFRRNNGEFYYFDIGSNILEGTDTASALNKTITPKKCTYSVANHWIVDISGNKYILFNGFYAPLSGSSAADYTANIQRMATVTSYSNTTTAPKYTYDFATAPVIYNQETGYWKLDSTRYTPL